MLGDRRGPSPLTLATLARMRPNFGPMYSTFHLTIGPWIVGFYISQERCCSFACLVAVGAWLWLRDVAGCIELMFWSKSIQCSQHSSSLLLAKLAGYGDFHNWGHPGRVFHPYRVFLSMGGFICTFSLLLLFSFSLHFNLVSPIIALKPNAVELEWYRESLPYANFISVNFITAIFQNFPNI